MSRSFQPIPQTTHLQQGAEVPPDKIQPEDGLFTREKKTAHVMARSVWQSIKRAFNPKVLLQSAAFMGGMAGLAYVGIDKFEMSTDSTIGSILNVFHFTNPTEFAARMAVGTFAVGPVVAAGLAGLTNQCPEDCKAPQNTPQYASAMPVNPMPQQTQAIQPVSGLPPVIPGAGQQPTQGARAWP